MKKKIQLLVLGIIVFFSAFQVLMPSKSSSDLKTHNEEVKQQTRSSNKTITDDLERLQQAYQRHESKVWMTISGKVVYILSDDNEGSRHQRFILKVDKDLTVLVAHNIDLAKRVPLKKGDQIQLRGRYEWNEKGGVLHWTHHNPNGKKGGWIRLNGEKYH